MKVRRCRDGVPEMTALKRLLLFLAFWFLFVPLLMLMAISEKVTPEEWTEDV